MLIYSILMILVSCPAVDQFDFSPYDASRDLMAPAREQVERVQILLVQSFDYILQKFFRKSLEEL